MYCHLGELPCILQTRCKLVGIDDMYGSRVRSSWFHDYCLTGILSWSVQWGFFLEVLKDSAFGLKWFANRELWKSKIRAVKALWWHRFSSCNSLSQHDVTLGLHVAVLGRAVYAIYWFGFYITYSFHHPLLLITSASIPSPRRHSRTYLAGPSSCGPWIILLLPRNKLERLFRCSSYPSLPFLGGFKL